VTEVLLSRQGGLYPFRVVPDADQLRNSLGTACIETLAKLLQGVAQ
jgi:hypothetical protein